MKKKLFIISTVLEIIFLLFSVYYFVFATEENLSTENIETNLVSALSGWTKKYSLTNPEITSEGPNTEKTKSLDTLLAEINKVLQDENMYGSRAESYLSGVNSMILQPYNNIYCVKHHKGLSKAGRECLATFKTEHTSCEINMNNYIVISPTKGATPDFRTDSEVFKDIMDKDEVLTRETVSNFQLIKWWNGDLKNIDNKYGMKIGKPSSVIPYIISFDKGEFIEWDLDKQQFIVKPKVSEALGWDTYQAQSAIWAATGDNCDDGCFVNQCHPVGSLEKLELYKAARAVDEYDTQVESHKQDPVITVGNGAGAVLVNDNTYRVGPFTMSDYAYAYSEYVKEYSGKDVDKYKGLIGGIDGMQITIKEDNGIFKQLNVDNSKVKIVYNDWYGKATSKGGRDRYTGEYTNNIPDTENIYPAPSSTFYIDITKSEIPNNATLETISISYRKTEVTGTGTVVIPRYIETTLTLTDTGIQGCSQYVCPRERCEHGHKNCHVAQWTVSSWKPGYGQPMLIADEAECIVSSTPKDFKVGIRITTEIKIKKYIKEVKHSTNGEVTFGSANKDKNSGLLAWEDRSSKTDEKKKANPIYAEYGDTITYQIDIINKQTYAVKVKVKDVLPTNIDKNDMGGLKNNEWITIPAAVLKTEKGKKVVKESIKSFTITVRTKANDTKEYVNEVNLITKNLTSKDKDTNVDFIRTTDKYAGPVVNMAEIQNIDNLKSRDYFKINDYNISIDKYLSKYNAEMTKSNNDAAFTNEKNELENRANKNDTYKSTHPVAVEQSETFVYTIKLKNNSTKGSGHKLQTQVRPTTIIDELDSGLEICKENDKFIITGKILKSDGKNVTLKEGTYSIKPDTNNTQKFSITLSDKHILNPGETLVYEIKVTATKSNLYLGTLKNAASISVLTNINNSSNVARIVRTADKKVNRNTNTKESASEYVKMKDVVISGKVWLDTNKDGIMQITEDAMKGIKVKLYTSDGTLVRTTVTDSNGLYTFARKEDGSYYSGKYSYKDNKILESEQRIPKATNKDTNQNYTKDSKYISYYIEYEYDGLIYKSTVYSGANNLNSDDSMKKYEAYKYDSNAAEFNQAREEFNKNYEIISYNKANNGNLSSSQALEYDKDNHNSYLKTNTQRMIIARSFINTDTQETNYLFLHTKVNGKQPYTEYLKYINLGLQKQREVDISLTQDVYEVKTTINGEEMTYEYNQNNNVLGNAKLDKEQEKDSKGKETAHSKAFDSERFITGYQNDNGSVEDNRVLYNFEYYLEDYNYRVSQYNIETVRAYKGSNVRNFNDNAVNDNNSVILANSVGRESELNTEVTFRIKVTNNKQSNSSQDKTVFAGINEIVEYYDKDFVNLTFNGDGTLRGFNVKTKDSNGYLVNQEVKVVSAVAVMKDGSEKAVTLSNSSKYNTTRNLPNYYTLYISSAVENTYLNAVTNQGIKAGDLMLAEGESLDILITFVIEKQIAPDDVKEIETILGVKENVAEISAYSTYYKEGNSYKPAGLVDIDSNPGNFGEIYGGVSDVDSQKYIKYFEDDTFKTGINFRIPTNSPNNPEEEERYLNNVQRTLTGFVWDDARTNEAKDTNGTQYVGDGIYDTSKKAKEKAKKNSVISEEKDIKVQDVKVELVEIIRMPDSVDSNIERTYENVIKTTRTSSDGKYKLRGYVPGEYIVRFIYGDDVSKDNMLIFNGQDYKSTSYQTSESVYAENAIADGDKAASDKTLEILEHKGNSDAKDDEIRRLEVIGYSETMTNERNKVLRGINSTDKTALINNTSMEAATPEFLVRPEKEIKKVIKLKFIEHNKKITETITEARFAINNIDFGLQYRPELQVALNNYLSNITVTTSDESGVTQTPLVDAIFEPYYGIVKNTDTITGITSFVTDSNGEIIKVDPMSPNTVIENAITTAGGKIKDAQKNNDGTYVIALAGTMLNTDKSVGLMNLQYLPNEYILDGDGRPKVEVIEGQYVVKATQGFAYIVLDDSIMQGATIKVKYLLSGSNFSEIDRVSSNLSDLRFKENKETEKYAKVGGNVEQYYEEVVYQISADAQKPTFINQNYSAALTARNALFSEYYRYELEGNTIKKDLNGQNNVVYAVKHKDMPVDGKIIKIVDITNPHKGNDGYYGRYLGSTYYTGAINKTMEVVAELKLDKIIDYIDNDLVFNDSDNKGKNGLWKTTTSSELYQEKWITEDAFSAIDITGKVTLDNTATFMHKLLDSEDREYDTDARSNLALSLDDRVRDDYAAGETDQTVNEEISQFLMPRYAKSLESYGTITITASKILSPEDKSDDMTYENIAEIIQYTSVTGRVTNLATTIGNAKIEEIGRNSNESPEFYEARTESDTASVEKITLTPPTGLGKINQAVRNVVESASYVVFVVIGVMLVCVIIAVSIHVYHRRRIK